MRQARLLVIESYLGQTNPQDAYALMLRYQQDFRRVDHETAALFVDALLAAGMEPACYAAELWRSYVATAQEIANQNQLLLGDDANWTDYASRRLASNPVTARAFYAYLAQQGKVRGTRQNAQLQLVFPFQGSRLGLAAVRLLDDTAHMFIGHFALVSPPKQLPRARHSEQCFWRRLCSTRSGRCWS